MELRGNPSIATRHSSLVIRHYSCGLSFPCLFVTFCGFAHELHFLGMWTVNNRNLWLHCFALLLLFQAPALAQSSGQAAITPATIFPDKLLDGMKNFNMAILLQG